MRSGTSKEAHETGKKVFEAFRDVGFAYIKNHGLPQELLDQAFEWVSKKHLSLTVHETRLDV
jgi:isopenicillin N synthase-like dioxygenase